ncbi:type IV pilus modification protein PilV [Microbulbifer sp. SSSA002]|uniref:type IV pilus modification protein PilV n=1 Tax=unclassified Microbulbifer TaxID=2619833 RepID=UPI004039DB97
MKSLNSQRGVGLIEVLVTVLILSTSLLGLAALQNKALQYNHSAYMRSQANILAQDIFERLRANRENLSAYELTVDDATPTASSSRAEVDLGEWRGLLSASLPAGTGGITCNANDVCTVTVQWGEEDSTGSGNDAGTSSFQYMTRI